MILPRGFPIFCARPLFTIKDDVAINGNRDGTKTLRQRLIPFNAPFEQLSEKIRIEAQTARAANALKTVPAFPTAALIYISITTNIYD